MKKSKLASRKKKSDNNKAGPVDPSDDLAGMMKKHHIDENGANANVNLEKSRNSDVETQLREVREENQYLRLLLGIGHKVDQLYEIWTGHFPNAFSSAETLQTYLELHSKQKQSELIIKTFRHVETIKKFLTDHKSQMLVSASLGENTSSISDDHSDGVSSNISSSQNNENHVPLGGPDSQDTPNIIQSEMEVISTFSTSKERVDLGRMMSQQVWTNCSLFAFCIQCQIIHVSGPDTPERNVPLQGNVSEGLRLQVSDNLLLASLQALLLKIFIPCSNLYIKAHEDSNTKTLAQSMNIKMFK